MTDHHIHPDPAVRALVERAKAEALREAADVVNAERTEHLISSTRAPAAGPLFRVEQRLRARADSLAAQPAPERRPNACAKCGDCYHPAFGPDTDGNPCDWCQDCGCPSADHQPAPEAATVEEQHCPTCACGCTCGYGGLHEPENPNCDLVRRKP